VAHQVTTRNLNEFLFLLTLIKSYPINILSTKKLSLI